LYTRNGVFEADPPWLSRALLFIAAATTSADDSAGRFNGLLYTRNGVLADALPDPLWLSRELSLIAAATISADDSAGRFDGLLGCSSFDAAYNFREGYDGDGDTVEGPVELEDRLISRFSCRM
jgi:hypothetical protein